MARKSFKCTTVEYYEDTGKIKYMEFTENKIQEEKIVENASRALIMAAGVLVGVLLLSLAVYLFTIFGNFGSEMTTQMNEKNLSEFNAQFTKYESYQDENGKWQNTCRAQDVVTIANLAKENNNKYEYTVSDANTGYYYVKVIVKNVSSNYKDNFEIASLNDYTTFLANYSGESIYSEEQQKDIFNVIYFKCTDIKINENSKRVCSITFTRMK